VLHFAFKLRLYQLEVYQVVAPSEGVFVAKVEAWAWTVPADVGFYLPGPFEGVVVESAVRASACGKANIAVNTVLGVY